MPFFVLILLFLNTSALLAQYHFSGEVCKENAGNAIYLSVVEDYRKSSRIYLDQIVKKSLVDSLGHFQFGGNNLKEDNRIYRIHLDGCTDEDANHFLGECNNSKSVLFIANNKDTVQFPTSFEDQSLCTITSTNPKSGLLMEVDALKEVMIYDLVGHNGKAKEHLNFRKWFKTLHEFSKQCGEPLAELYVYDLLSNRANETHTYYSMDIKINPYYEGLLERLAATYPNAAFTEQYRSEIRADKGLMDGPTGQKIGFRYKYFLYPILLVLLVQVGYHTIKSRKRKVEKKAREVLTPQELKIFEAMGQGKSNKEIASQFFISLSTVKTHINNIYKKLDSISREEIKSSSQNQKST